MNLETVFTSGTPVECHIVKGRLEAEGIPCFVFDENIVWADPFKSVLVGGVKLKVPADRVENAQKIIKSVEDGEFRSEAREDEPEQEAVEPNMEIPEKILCPYCGSENVRRGYAIDNKWNPLYLILTVLMMAPFPLFRKNYHCFDCKKSFKGD